MAKIHYLYLDKYSRPKTYIDKQNIKIIQKLCSCNKIQKLLFKNNNK